MNPPRDTGLAPGDSGAVAPEAPEHTATGRTWLFYGAAACVLFLDQITKWLVVQDMPLGQSHPILGPVLSFTHSHNTGAAFGMMPSAALGLAVVAAFVIVILVVFGRRAAVRSGPLLIGISLQLGGAAGNFLDRIRLGYVVDFIDVHFWPVFNVADIGITCGAILVVAAILFDPRLKDTS